MASTAHDSTEKTPLAPLAKPASFGSKLSDHWRSHWSKFHSPEGQKKRLAVCAGLWGLLTGMERAIIFPTLWLYFFKIFNLQAAITYYGITLAAFNLSILITSPIYGYLGHRGVPVRILLLISNQLEIVGNVIYFVAGTPWLVLIGRFVAGLGGGSEVSLYADIVRATTRAERTPLIVILLLARQFGLIAGPAATLIMDPINLTVGHINFNVYNMPGLFMAITWAFHTIILVLLYPSIPKPEEDVVTPESSAASDIDEAPAPGPTADTEAADSSTTGSGSKQHHRKRRHSRVRVKEMRFREAIRFYLKWEISATVACTFATYFCLMALEAVLPPVAKAYFRWNEVETSWVYLACGFGVILVYGVLRGLSDYVQDRRLLVAGLVILGIGYIYLMSTMIAIDPNRRDFFIVLTLVGVGVHVIGQPFVVACSESLYTKCIPMSDLDRGQSYLRLVINVAILFGPYVGGSLQAKPFVVFLLMFVSIAVAFVICVIAYPHMIRPDEEEEETPTEETEEEVAMDDQERSEER